MKKVKKVSKVAKEVAPTKKVKATKKVVKEVAKAKTGPAIGGRKDLMYKYPEGCDTLAARKLFRASARKKLQTLRKSLKAIEAGKKEGDAKVSKQALIKFKSTNFNKAEEKTTATK